MTSIPQLRLHNQCITRTGHRRPADLVAWLGAVQAQEFGPAKWGLGLRLPETTTEGKIDRAFDAGEILRTHVMRPTWHFVARADIRWMLELTAPRVHQTLSHYLRRQGLDIATRTRAAAVFERVLDGHALTRSELGTHLGRAGIVARGMPLALLTIFAELEGVICSGPRRGKEFTYAQVAERAPNARRLPRDEALAELTLRYFRSHGPATIRDFVWWSGLTTPDAKRGLEINRARSDAIDGCTYWTTAGTPRRSVVSRSVHLLPIYDEYLVSVPRPIRGAARTGQGANPQGGNRDLPACGRHRGPGGGNMEDGADVGGRVGGRCATEKADDSRAGTGRRGRRALQPLSRRAGVDPCRGLTPSHILR